MEEKIERESRRFVDSLIEINKKGIVNGKTLDDLFDELVDKKLKKHKLRILVYLTVYLAEKNYELKNSKEFGLIDFN